MAHHNVVYAVVFSVEHDTLRRVTDLDLEVCREISDLRLEWFQHLAGLLHHPANSFALARAVEYFRIARNVLTICLARA